MKVEKTARGFEIILLNNCSDESIEERLVGVSSVIGDYDDSFQRPGSSYLWVGDKHHLNREQVTDLVSHLQSWLKTGSLQKENKAKKTKKTLSKHKR